MKISYRSQIQNQGWNAPVTDGATSGTVGLGLRLEAFEITLLDLGGLNLAMEYQAHVENQGWQGLKTDGQTAGTVGLGLRLEALRIRLTGTDAKKYSIKYRVHVENIGWQLWCKDGETAGTEGQALRAEAIEILIVLQDENIDITVPDNTIQPIQAIPPEKILCASYSTHVENYGWGADVTDGRLSGRVGKGLRMEAIRISLMNIGTQNLGVSYSTHIENIGWQAPVSDGATSGTTDEGLRMEAIKINMTGADANKYSIWYRVHVQNEAWQDWRRDGEIAGTTGVALRAEAIQIIITLKSDNLLRTIGPEATMSVNYRSHIENIDWVAWTKNGQKSGTTGRGLRMEAFELKLSALDGVNLGVEYRAHVQNIGWQGWVVDGATAGTVGQGLRLEAIEIRLTGADASKYSIQYRVHVENKGWSTWGKDGSTAGTVGESLRMEAISVVIVVNTDLNEKIKLEIKNKVPYIQVWACEYPGVQFLIHDIRIDNKLSGLKWTGGANKNESLTFTIAPTHNRYNDLHKLKTIIYVYEIDANNQKRKIYEGRILSDQEDINKNKAIVCEGELAYLLDGVQRPAKYENQTTEQWLTMVLDNHNMSVEADKRFHMGIVTVTDTKDDALRENDYTNTMDLINSTLINSLGGYLVIEHIGSLRFLNYLENYGVVNTQPIELGKNLLDLNKISTASDIITALIPVGKDIDGKKLNIALVNDNCDYIYDEVAVNEYGWIFGFQEWADIDNAQTLLEKGTAYLQTATQQGITIELTALDLSLVNMDIQKINVGDSLRCVSKPNGIDTFLTVTKRERDLEDPTNDRITIGDAISGITDYASGSGNIKTAASNPVIETAKNTVKNTETVNNEISKNQTIIAGTVIANKVITDDLVARVAHIDYLFAGNIEAVNIKTGTITAESGIIANAAITTAMIADGSIIDSKIVSLTAEKLVSGIIDTSKITVLGANGKLRIANNRLQVFDNQTTPTERVSLGDVNGDGTVFGFRVRGADGTTILIDETGVKAQGITDGTITNAKISSNADINGTKLLDNSIAGGKLVIDAITAREIAANTITANEILAGSLTSASGVFGSIDASIITSGTINAARLNLTGYATFTSLATAGSTTINGSNITTGTISASRINFTGALNGYSSGTSLGFTVSSNGIMSIPTSAYINFGSSGSSIKSLGQSYGGFIVGGVGEDISISPSSGYYSKVGNLYATTQPYNVPMTTTVASTKVTEIAVFYDSGASKYYLNATCNGTSRGAYFDISDAKFKTNINDSTIDALQEISQVKIRSFNWIETGNYNSCGIVAQEIEKDLGRNYVLKIKQPEGDYDYQIASGEFIPLLIKGIQELNTKQKEITARLQNDIAVLKIICDQQQAEIEKLKTKVA